MPARRAYSPDGKAFDAGEFMRRQPIELLLGAPADDDQQEVIVTDIRMSFGSMVVFMVKWAFASIPAAIILFVLGTMMWSFLFGLITPHR